jgi:hypothetical protein
MKQTSLLGKPEPIVTNVKMPIQAADASRKIGLTCWDRCDHCGLELHGKAPKVYRLCKRVGCKCYHLSEICEWVEPPLPGPPVKPQASSWNDY